MRISEADCLNSSLREYESLLDNARQSVNQASTVLRNEELKKEFTEAVEAFIDQSEVWKEGLENNRIVPGSPAATKLQQKYSFKTEGYTEDIDIYKSREIYNALKAIRKAADEHVERAQQLAIREGLLKEQVQSMDTPGLQSTPEPSPRNVEYGDALKFVNWGQIIAVEGHIVVQGSTELTGDPRNTYFKCDDSYCYLKLCPKGQLQCYVYYNGHMPPKYFDFPDMMVRKSIIEPPPTGALRPEAIRYRTVEGKIVNYRNYVTVIGKVMNGRIEAREIRLR